MQSTATQGAQGPLGFWNFTIFYHTLSKKGRFLSFEREKLNFITFGHLWKIFMFTCAKIRDWPPGKILPASNPTIQPLINLQNKAIKIINSTDTGSPEEHFQHLNILCLPKLCSFSVGKFMHSYHNKLLPNHFDEYFVPLSSIHYHYTRHATSTNLFFLELTFPQENVLLNLLAQNYGH